MQIRHGSILCAVGDTTAATRLHVIPKGQTFAAIGRSARPLARRSRASLVEAGAGGVRKELAAEVMGYVSLEQRDRL